MTFFNSIFPNWISRRQGKFYTGLPTNPLYDRFFAGNLSVPTGQIVCSDPLYRELCYPQSWRIHPGDYPAFLYIGLNGDFWGRIAYAEIVIQEEIPVSWELSLISEDFLSGNAERKANGRYPVENGLSSFSDYETFKIYTNEIDTFYKQNLTGNYYLDILEGHFKKNAQVPMSSRGEDWINYTPQHCNSNIIMFGSGLGDGFYSRYVGYNKSRQAVRFITDFVSI